MIENIKLLDSKYPGRLVSSNGNMIGAFRSCDLTPLIYFFSKIVLETNIGTKIDVWGNYIRMETRRRALSGASTRSRDT